MRRKTRWLPGLLVAVVVFALAMMGLSGILFSRWSDLRTVSPEDADRAFAAAVAEAGGGPPYLEISADGIAHLRTDLERSPPTELRTLHLLAWEPARGQLLQVSFPFWFVRLKLAATVNVGKLASVLAHHWENLDVEISVAALQRRGPGLVLDHRLADGARILLWTE